MNEAQQPWLIDESFPYSRQQFMAMGKVTLAITVISTVGSLTTVLFFAVFVYQKGQMADRVSLRCVATASFVNLVDAITNMAMVLYQGAIIPCRVLAILVQFTDVLGACLLSTIGVNLVLVFVIKVKRSNILERVYYPFCVIYSLTTLIIPIYEEVQIKNEHPPRVDCWVYNNFTHRKAHFDSWIYFYSLVFFIMVVGLLCAVIASIKLLREEYQNHKIIHGGSLADTSNNGLRFSESNAYRVITRCIIYSSVPFFCHIFGFSLHLAGLSSRTIPLGFTAVYSAMSVAEGTMTTLVFFSEPAVCEYIREISRTWHQKYVEEFRIVERPDRRRSSATIASTGSQQTLPKLREYYEKASLPPRMQARSPRACYEIPAMSNSIANQQQDLGDPSLLQVPATPDPDSLSLTSTTTTTSSKISSADSNTRSVPMRRVKPHSPVYNRIHRKSLINRSCPAILSSEDERKEDNEEPDYYIVETPDTSDNEVYIPYRFPRLARIVNWILIHFAKDNQRDSQHNNGADNNAPPPNSIIIDSSP